MTLPCVRMDFNSNSLANRWTQEDVRRQGIELRDGMRLVFYDFDTEDDVPGLLHTAGTIWWDDTTGRFRLDLRTVAFGFLPGRDPTKLGNLYSE
jgi:hypothetical protein